MSELKACPFCGGNAHIARESDSDGFGTFYTVKCDKCGAETAPRYASTGDDCPIFYSEVRDEWNQRAPDLQELENRLVYIALHGDRGNPTGLRREIRAAIEGRITKEA